MIHNDTYSAFQRNSGFRMNATRCPMLSDVNIRQHWLDVLTWFVIYMIRHLGIWPFHGSFVFAPPPPLSCGPLDHGASVTLPNITPSLCQRCMSSASPIHLLISAPHHRGRGLTCEHWSFRNHHGLEGSVWCIHVADTYLSSPGHHYLAITYMDLISCWPTLYHGVILITSHGHRKGDK